MDWWCVCVVGEGGKKRCREWRASRPIVEVELPGFSDDWLWRLSTLESSRRNPSN